MSSSAHVLPNEAAVVRHTPETVETKASSKTTELYVYVLAVAAVILTAFVVGDDGDGSGDPFGALNAIQYVTYLTIGYMIARGLAKSGSRGSRES